MTYIAVLVFGLIIGSFLGAFSYRFPKGISIAKGRSFCPKCKHNIAWYDNIPLFSYLILKGHCRSCRQKISIRYPIIEATTAVLLLAVILGVSGCSGIFSGSLLCTWQQTNFNVSLAYVLFILGVLLLITIIDIEHEIIPDPLVYTGIAATFLFFLLINIDGFYLNFLSGLLAGLFFLLLNGVTKGKGMGLGDAKLALLGGFILGWPETFIWLVSSFSLGAVVGMILILFGKSKFGREIPFAPYLMISLIITLLTSSLVRSLINI